MSDTTEWNFLCPKCMEISKVQDGRIEQYARDAVRAERVRVRETIHKLSYITDEGDEYLEFYVPNLLVALGYDKNEVRR